MALLQAAGGLLRVSARPTPEGGMRVLHEAQRMFGPDGVPPGNGHGAAPALTPLATAQIDRLLAESVQQVRDLLNEPLWPERRTQAGNGRGVSEAVGYYTEPYLDSLGAQGYQDVGAAGDAAAMQWGTDFYGAARTMIIWRARWLSRAAPMAKQALRIYTGFVLNTGIPKPLTKATRQLTKESTEQNASKELAAKAPPLPVPVPSAGQSAPSSGQRPRSAREADAPLAGTGASADAGGRPAPHPVQQIIDETWDDPDNAQWTTQDGLEETMRHRQVDGDLLWAIFTDDETGHVKIRRLESTRLVDIIADPEDVARPLYYTVRPLVQTQNPTAAAGTATAMGAYQPGGEPPGNARATMVNDPGPTSTGVGVGRATGDLVYRDWRNTVPERDPYRTVFEDSSALQGGVVLAYFAINRIGKFGLSELFAGIDWLRAHKRFSENRASLTEALRRIALLLTVKGGQQQVSSAQQLMQSSLTTWPGGGASGSGLESNPAPATGAIFTGNPGAQLEQFKVQTGGAEAALDAEGLLQLFAASVGFATHYFGSSNMHRLAVATAMELPILRYLQAEQSWWQAMLRALLDYALKEAVRAKRITGAQVQVKYGYEAVDWGDVDPSYDIELAPLVNVDPLPTIQAIVAAHGDSLITDEDAAHKVYTALGSDNVDDQLGRWAAWFQHKQERATALAVATAPGRPPGSPGGPGSGGPGGAPPPPNVPPTPTAGGQRPMGQLGVRAREAEQPSEAEEKD